MAGEPLSYNNEFWDRTLPSGEYEACQSSTTRKIHLVTSLILYLSLPLKDLLHFLFSPGTEAVSRLAGQFIAFRKDFAIRFGPSDVFILWHENFPKCRPHLHERIIEPCAREIVLKESNAAIKDPSLKISVKNLTMANIRDLLSPARLASRLRSLAPFLFGLLEVFTTSPNRYKKRRASKKARETTENDLAGSESDPDDDGEGEGIEEVREDTGETGNERPSRGIMTRKDCNSW